MVQRALWAIDDAIHWAEQHLGLPVTETHYSFCCWIEKRYFGED